MVKLSLVLIHILKVYFKRSSSFLWEKICSIHYLQFSFEKHELSQVLQDFSVENLQTTSSTFLSKFLISNYWGSIFHCTYREESLACFVFYPYFFPYFFFVCFSIDVLLNDSYDSRKGGGIIFLVFYFQPLTNIHLFQRDFNHFCTSFYSVYL